MSKQTFEPSCLHFLNPESLKENLRFTLGAVLHKRCRLFKGSSEILRFCKERTIFTSWSLSEFTFKMTQQQQLQPPWGLIEVQAGTACAGSDLPAWDIWHHLRLLCLLLPALSAEAAFFQCICIFSCIRICIIFSLYLYFYLPALDIMCLLLPALSAALAFFFKICSFSSLLKLHWYGPEKKSALTMGLILTGFFLISTIFGSILTCGAFDTLWLLSAV